MRVNKYEVFLCVAKTGSMSQAAAMLDYTQSGVSYAIKNLEDELGLPLFRRTPHGVQLNEEGRALLPIINRLMRQHEYLSQTVLDIKGIQTGTIKLASFTSVAIRWLPRVLRDFRALYPDIQVQIIEAGVYGIEQMIAEGKADLGIFAKSDSFAYDWLTLREDPLYAVLPRDHPAADWPLFPLSAFADSPFIAPSPDFDFDIHRVLNKLERWPQIKFSFNNDYTIIAMVAAGLGVSILPGLILHDIREDIRVLPIEPAQYRVLGIGMQNKKNLTPVVKIFSSFLQEYDL